MIYFDLIVNCIESGKSYNFCPNEVHTHKLKFTIGILSENVTKEDVVFDELRDCITDSIYVESWDLRTLTETMIKELLASGFKIVKIKAELQEIPVSIEIISE